MLTHDSVAERPPESPVAVSSSHSIARPFWQNTYLHVAILIAIVALCFVRTLGSFFLADDFGEVYYVSKIFNGHPELIWANFTGPYIQNPTILVWRPFMLMSQVVDYGIWGPNPFGYYLTNLLYYCGNVLLAYYAMRQLTRTWGSAKGRLASLVTAGLFAANPLHCESVSWMVGRVDILSSFYYLLAFNLYLSCMRVQSTFKLAAGTLCFWVAMWCKEMAIFLPALVSAAYLLVHEQQSPIGVDESRIAFLKRRLKNAIAFAAPLWISLALYFPLRFAVLGTFLGGYTGDIGASQSAGLLQRWTDLDTLGRLFLPLNYGLFGGNSIYHTLILGCFACIGGLTVFRVLAGALPWRWLLFLGLWGVTAVLPIYKLWGIGHNLEGGRFYFFLSVPLAMLLPVLVLHPWPVHRAAKDLLKLERNTWIAGFAVLTMLLIVFCKVTYSTNLLWVHAGKEVKSFWRQCTNIATKIPPDTKVALLGIPKDHDGAHMILNAMTFAQMMSPPFTKAPLNEKFFVFDPLFYGHDEAINASAFKRAMLNWHTAGMFVWQGTKNGFRKLEPENETVPLTPLELIPYAVNQNWQVYTRGHQKTLSFSKAYVRLSELQQNDGLRIFNMKLQPLRYDFLEFELRRKPADQPATITAAWNNLPENYASVTLPAEKANTANLFRRVRIRLSHNWRWYATNEIKELELLFSPMKEADIRHPRLIADVSVAPVIELPDLKPNFANVAPFHAPSVRLLFDGRNVDNASGVEVQVSKPNYFFDNFKEQDEKSFVAHRLTNGSVFGELALPEKLFSSNGYYQIRSRCLDNMGLPVGEFSEPLTVNYVRGK